MSWVNQIEEKLEREINWYRFIQYRFDYIQNRRNKFDSVKLYNNYVVMFGGKRKVFQQVCIKYILNSKGVIYLSFIILYCWNFK